MKITQTLLLLLPLALLFGAMAWAATDTSVRNYLGDAITRHMVSIGAVLPMSQMSTGDARTVDPVLTTVARGYHNNELVGTALFPVVPVGQRGGKIIKFGKENFRQYRTARSPGANTARVQFGFSSDKYSLEQHALDGVLPYEIQEEAQAGPGVDLSTGTIVSVQEIIGLRVEVAQAALARNLTAYAASNKVTLSGTDQWSDDNSNPGKDIRDAQEAIRSQTGKRPTVAVMGAKVFAFLQEHPLILDRTKYTSKESITPQILAALWNLDQVLIGDAIQELDNGTLSDIWGRDVILAFAQKAGVGNRGLPSYGYTYRLAGYPSVETPWYDRNAKSWIYPVTDELEPVIVGADAGFIINNAVAA